MLKRCIEHTKLVIFIYALPKKKAVNSSPPLKIVIFENSSSCSNKFGFGSDLGKDKDGHPAGNHSVRDGTPPLVLRTAL